MSCNNHFLREAMYNSQISCILILVEKRNAFALLENIESAAM